MLNHGIVAITGAGQGLGLAMAVEFALRGYPVLALNLFEEHHEAVEKATAGLPGKVECQVLDVTKAGDFAFPDNLEILINNAGIRLKNYPVEMIGMDEWRRYMEVNFLGVVDMARRAIPVMKKRKRGVICNINSGSSTMPYPFLGPYRAAKGAVGQFSETLRTEIQQFGIRVMEILPGGIATGLTSSSMGNKKTEAANLPDYAKLADNLLEHFQSRDMTYINAEEAAKVITDAIEEKPGKFRYGTDETSNKSIENWRAGGGDPVMSDFINKITPKPQ
jgi:NAD(P)-dependent dehydrogenase (short-subunit alcohol dehydrogenase family)